MSGSSSRMSAGGDVGRSSLHGDTLYLSINNSRMSIALPLERLPKGAKFDFGAGREITISEMLGQEMADPEIWLGVAVRHTTQHNAQHMRRPERGSSGPIAAHRSLLTVGFVAA